METTLKLLKTGATATTKTRAPDP